MQLKLYAFKIDDHEEKKCKGIKKSVIQRQLTLENYKDCLFTEKDQMRKMNIIKLDLHDIYSVKINKIALFSQDD